MEVTLKLGGLTAVTESFGGELVSLRDESGTEYIWSGAAPYWSGRNPVLFPIVGRLPTAAKSALATRPTRWHSTASPAAVISP